MKQTFILAHDNARKNAVRAVQEAAEGYAVTISEPTRTLEQNALLWALLREVAQQVEWYGQKLSEEDWKNVFTAALKRYRVVPGIDGGMVVLGMSTSKMDKREFSDLIEVILSFGAERGVVFDDGDRREADRYLTVAA